jgi:hypothetical protein
LPVRKSLREKLRNKIAFASFIIAVAKKSTRQKVF